MLIAQAQRVFRKFMAQIQNRANGTMNALNGTDAKLMKALMSRQQKERWSDSEMAKLVGVSQPLWSLTRRGHQPIGLKLLRGIVRARAFDGKFDLLVIDFLRGK